MTGADGCETEHYLSRHWQHSDWLETINVDVSTVDPGIQEDL
ncbi:hypothetical protein DB30_04512 [Enhygromyxa salina]|uniref:Uncharacterized protein n=2 Tax=Enhygromyxa salina TaxID=215803 RepID=A0A0C2D3P3_9BACT|nr:hypothetical protein DB30_04512 [Enhygromyxa salina]